MRRLSSALGVDWEDEEAEDDQGLLAEPLGLGGCISEAMWCGSWFGSVASALGSM